MKGPKLPHGRVVELLHYDPETGAFVNKTGRYKGRRMGSVDATGLAKIYVGGWHVGAARLAWFYVTGEWPTREVGTKNGNKADLRFENLLLDPRVKHGHTPYWGKASSTYQSWAAMISRCTNPNNKRWSRYGGRGITFCETWKDFRNFLADMGEKPDGLTLDRINNDGNYEPSNCRWADSLTQGGNSSKVRKITAFGKTQSLRGWSQEVNLSMGVIAERLDAGLDPETALSLKKWKRPPELARAKSGYEGVTHSHHKSRPWRAAVMLNGKLHHLGFFKTPDEAHTAREAAKRGATGTAE